MSIRSLFYLALGFVAQPVLGGFYPYCDDSAPAIKDTNTVNVQLYADYLACGTPFQTSTIGLLERCHTALATVGSFKMAVGQNMFGRSLRVWAFESETCSGDHRGFSLTNQEEYFSVAGGSLNNFKSFFVNVTAYGSSSPLDQ
ncbi:hypothetical protein GQ53DRAFT_804106 [Thozetella sp. PMI_491]|nr:hypothetical protein GQ53DRAFT_804106 [Thozetella sp. PMI_491]